MKYRLLGLVWIVASAAIAACSSSDVTGVDKTARLQPDTANLFGFPPRLVVCPSSTTSTDTEVIGPLGGLLSAGGTTVSIPVGALLESVTMTLTVPASRYMEIDVSVEGHTSFLFETPITVSMDYSRCSSWFVRLLPNTVYHIDTETKALLQPMPTIDDKLTLTATFTTPHLSGYALAN